MAASIIACYCQRRVFRFFLSFFFLVDALIGLPLIEVLKDFFQPYFAVDGRDFLFFELDFRFLIGLLCYKAAWF
jgi:hypothetical protein